MKRLLSPSPNGGLPYVNSDFNDILQSQHIKAYAGNLDSINDKPFSNSGSFDRGIILLGCTPYNATSTSTTFDFTRSLIYLPKTVETGDFYEADPSIANSAYIVNSNLVYLTISETFESRIFRSGANEQVLVKGYFTVTTTPPATPYIEFLNGKTKRNYKRVLKYALANTNDVMMTGNTSDFDLGTGLGVGDMYGFALCNGSNSTFDLTGRFVIGFKNGAATTPVDNTTIWDTTTSTQTYNSTDIMNYGAIGNKGGGRLTDGLYYPSKVLIIPELPSHDHGSITGDPNVDLNHTHGTGQDAGSNYVFASGGANTGSSGGGDRGLDQSTRRYSASTGLINSAVASNANLQHRHGIPAQGSFNGHEIRSPYLVLAYYQKITV
jgi:hypothetical protein